VTARYPEALLDRMVSAERERRVRREQS
jgi:hypothetical protein